MGLLKPFTRDVLIQDQNRERQKQAGSAKDADRNKRVEIGNQGCRCAWQKPGNSCAHLMLHLIFPAGMEIRATFRFNFISSEEKKVSSTAMQKRRRGCLRAEADAKNGASGNLWRPVLHRRRSIGHAGPVGRHRDHRNRNKRLHWPICIARNYAICRPRSTEAALLVPDDPNSFCV